MSIVVSNYICLEWIQIFFYRFNNLDIPNLCNDYPFFKLLVGQYITVMYMSLMKPHFFVFITFTQMSGHIANYKNSNYITHYSSWCLVVQIYIFIYQYPMDVMYLKKIILINYIKNTL